jgi:hypothetical protein
MKSRAAYAFLSIIAAAIANVLINLLSAAIQQRAFNDQFSEQSIWYLSISIIVFLIASQLLYNHHAKAQEAKQSKVEIGRLKAGTGKIESAVHLHDVSDVKIGDMEAGADINSTISVNHSPKGPPPA